MITAIGLMAMLTALINDVETDVVGAFLLHVESTPLLDSTGKPLPRIGRDANGNVETLQLSGMQLSSDDFAAIGRIRTLRSLVLFRSNVTDENLRQLRGLPRLESLNLSSTDVSDAAIDEIVKFKALRSLCLGNVAVTPEAVARLKEHFHAHERRLSLGYSQRK
jgi:hypothetical protein